MKSLSEIMQAVMFRTASLYPDKLFLRIFFRLGTGYRLNLRHPVTYNEKLQWLKLNFRHPQMPMMVDKIAAKDWVRDMIGEEYLIPTLRTWTAPEEIKEDELPERFVLKTNNGGGNIGVVVCTDKSSFVLGKAVADLRKALNQPMYPHTREWPYKQIKPAILMEPFIEDKTAGELTDYKFFCFDGTVKAMFVATERSSGDVKFDYFDAEFNHLDLYQEHPMSGRTIPRPQNYDKMVEVASKLSKGWPHVRVDLYNAEGKIYFGEMTFFHHGGFVPFHPHQWDLTWGEWLKLPDRQIR